MLFVSKVDDRESKFEELYKTYRKYAWRICYKYIKNYEDIEDVLEDAFYKIAKKIDYSKDEQSIKKYIRRTVISHSLNHIRKNRKRKDDVYLEDYPHEIADYTYEPFEQLTISENKELLHNEIKKLPELISITMTHRYIDGYTPNEIADMLEIPVKTVYGRINKGKKQIIDALRKYLSVKGGVNNGK